MFTTRRFFQIFNVSLFFLIAIHHELRGQTSLIPNPFTFTTCGFGTVPVGWATCTGSPDCAASRATVPSGSTGAAVMCFGESILYTLPSPLTIGNTYSISMDVCVGFLGSSSIISGSHSFSVIGTTTSPSNCGSTNYGSACSTPSAITLLSGSQSTVGWQTFTASFTATAAIQYIVIGNCDATGNGGNLFSNFSLIPSNPITLSSAAGTDAQSVCVNTSITNISYTTTGSTSATVSGLPSGVTSSYAAGVVTISGTPTTAGAFSYTVTLTGGANNGATKTGTITVNPTNVITLTSATGTNSQIACINSPITSITYNTSGATGATFSGLPSGVNGNWAANQVTISGSSTLAGSFNYSVTTQGGCPPASTSGSITVNPLNTLMLSSAGGTDAQTVLVNTSIAAITYATTGATGATFSGLPAGVTGSWSANVATISGSPTTAVGSPFSYTITPTGGCGSANATGTITVNNCPTITVTNPTNSSGIIGTPFSENFTQTGGAPTVTFSTTSSLPAGLTLSATGVLSGTPTVTGSFPIIVVAQDGNSCTGTGSSYNLVINCPTSSVFYDGFETGSYSPKWTIIGGMTGAVTTTNPAVGTHRLEGYGTTSHSQGFKSTFAPATPSSVSWYIYPSGTNATNYFVAGDASTSSNNGIVFCYWNGGASSIRFYAGGNNDFAATPNQWHHIEMRNINWTTKSFDIWIDNSLKATSFPFRTTASTAFSEVYLYNFSGTSSVGIWDEIQFGGGTMATASPTAQSICTGTAITPIVLSGASPNATYHWSRNNTATVTGIASSGTGNISGTLTNLTTAPVTVTFTVTPDYYGVCAGTPYTATVTVNPKSADPASAIAIPTSICNGSNSYLSLNGGGGGTGAVVKWYTSACGGTLVGSGNSLPVSPSTTTTYYGRYEDGAPCNYNSQCAMVTVSVLPDNTVSLSSASGTDNQTTVVTAPITPITYATTGATGVVVIGLPPGVTGSWAGNVATISGSATATGTYNYTVYPTGGCGAVTATGTIDVIPCSMSLSSATGTDAQTVCSKNAITNITYATTGATSVTFSGLPTGVTGNWASNVATVSGTLSNPTASPITITFTITSFFNSNPCTVKTATVTVLPDVIVNASVSPLYPLAGQEIQTVYLGYPGCSQQETITANPSGGNNSYSYSWKKSACNNPSSLSSLGISTNSYTTPLASLSDICSGNNDNVYEYRIQVTDGNGCVGEEVKKLNVVNPYVGTVGNSNIIVCHRIVTRGSVLNQLLTVTPSQVAAHLQHGDQLGNCTPFHGKQVITEEYPQEVAVYPNPTTGVFIVEISRITEQADIVITDVQGRLVTHKTLAKNEPSTATFDLTNNAAGMYLIRVRDGEFSYNAKLILR